MRFLAIRGYSESVKPIILAIALAASASAAETNKVEAAKVRRAALEARLTQIQTRIETLQAEDNARMKAHKLKTGRIGKPTNTAAISALGAQANQIKAALIELDVAEGKLDKHKKQTIPRYGIP